jgi:hypothetical protein
MVLLRGNEGDWGGANTTKGHITGPLLYIGLVMTAFAKILSICKKNGNFHLDKAALHWQNRSNSPTYRFKWVGETLFAERALHESNPIATVAAMRGQAVRIVGNTTGPSLSAEELTAIRAGLAAAADRLFDEIEGRVRDAPGQ